MKKAVFILLLACSMWVACSPTKEEVENISNLKIAYNVYYDTAADNYEIFSMNADGTERKNISNWKGVDWMYYAYKDKIYFVSDRDTTHRMYFLYEMDADGNNVRKVSDLRLEDSWMSSRNNGTELVVAGRSGKERFQLFLIDVNTGTNVRITHDTTASFADPHFSPDGKQIVFRYRKNRRNFRDERAEIWKMDADGNNLTQLTHYPEADTTAKWHSYHAGPPIWNNSKNLISFISHQKGNHSIFTMLPDGADVKQITGDSLSEGWHSWSPKGQWIVHDLSDADGNWYDIAISKQDGTGLKKLADDWRSEFSPVFVEAKKN